MYPYAIGLDIGITSVGWATVALDAEEKPYAIIGMGSRIFDAAEQPKTGAPLAAPRREARSARRRLRRHRHRNERIRNLLVERLIPEDELLHLFDGQISDIYGLRVKALDEPVTRQEFARILIHIAQRRGFRSNRKGAASDEDGKILDAVNKNALIMAEKGYRTVAEMLCRDERFAEHKRNVGGEYISTVSRSMVEDEVHKIFAAQRAFGADFANTSLEEDYLTIMLSQRSFDEGPGGNSRYAGNQIDRMIGHCTFFPEEQRAAKATYSFEYFSLLEKLNHIRLVSNKETLSLTPDQIRNVSELAHRSENVSYAQIRKELGIGAEYRFNFVKYDSDKSDEDCEKKEKFTYLKAYHQIRKAFERVSKGSFSLVSRNQLDEIGTVLSKYKNGDAIESKLKEAGIEEAYIGELEKLSFSKYGHISAKACRMIIPYLEKGMNYSDACDAAGIKFKAHEGNEKSKLLKYNEEDFADITNPVVKRAISQTIKVVNAIIRKQGNSPVFINIELAREMSKDFKERNDIRKEYEANSAENEKIKQEIISLFKVSNPTGQDILKYRLFKEQQERCAYSLKQIELSRLFEPGYVEIDHIVPYSISFDDGRRNKVLVMAKENRDKGNRLPLEYLTGEKRDKFIVWTKANVSNKKKRELLLKEIVDTEGFKERNLQDTQYISRFMQNYLRDNLEFDASVTGKKKRVTAVNGAVTSYLRKRWGITKIRENGDLHHAVDALVIACTTDGLIQKVSRYSKYHESRYSTECSENMLVDISTGEVITEFPYPWEWFRKELEARLSDNPKKYIEDLKIPFYFDDEAPEVKPLFVSRMPKHKVTGAAHLDTIKSAREIDNGIAVLKRPLTDLKLKDGEIENYYNPGDDPILYEALKNRLLVFNGDAKKAFAEPFHKPKLDGTPGPLVKKVKLCEKLSLGVKVHGGNGIANNDSMVRIDVFYVDGEGYYFVPIYIADTVKPELPNKACVAFKPYSEWKEMKDENFIYSLYPNDLFEITDIKNKKLTRLSEKSTIAPTIVTKKILLYFIKAGISSAAVTCENHDGTYGISSLGIKTINRIDKYEVDVLGEYHIVKKEKRMGFHQEKE